MWKAKQFDELTVYDLRRIYALRVAVFVVEQACAYQEVDDLDLTSTHLSYVKEDDLVSYARLIPEEGYVRIGRVVVNPDYRKQGKGQELMQQAISYSAKAFPEWPLHVSAQAHLQDFYGSFGFKAVSDIYLEDAIPHIDMIRIQTEQEGVTFE